MSCNIDCLWGRVLLSSRNMGHSTVDYNEVGKGTSLLLEERQSLFDRAHYLLWRCLRTGEESSWRWNICRGWRFMMWWALYCGDPFLNYSFKAVISHLFPGYKTPPYGTFGIGHYSASQQAGISGEPGHLKCADASVFGTVRGNGRSGLEGLVYAREMSPILFLLQQMLLSMLLIIYCKLILVIGHRL